MGWTPPKFDFRIQPAAEVLSVCERKHDPVLALPTCISIHMDRYPARYSSTFRVAWFHRSIMISQCHAIPVVPENPPIPCLQVSKHLMCDGSQNVSQFRLMPPFAKSRKPFHNSIWYNVCVLWNRVPRVVDQGSGGPLGLWSQHDSISLAVPLSLLLPRKSSVMSHQSSASMLCVCCMVVQWWVIRCPMSSLIFSVIQLGLLRPWTRPQLDDSEGESQMEQSLTPFWYHVPGRW